MKSAITAAITAALLASADAAPARRTLSNAPFYLQIGSGNPAYDGQKLGICHIVAALESICLYADDTQVFQLSSTSGSQPPLPTGVTDSGDLVYIGEANGNNPQSMGLYTMIGSNIAPALLGLGTVQSVAFNQDGEMGYVSYYNDAAVPPTSITNGTLLADQWQICQYNFEGYVYQTLSWEYGTGPATQPSCEIVTVTRVYQ